MHSDSISGKSGYHHGNLRVALIEATDGIIRDRGIEGLSLREAARRAGVSIGAPAHHFGSTSGLLTEVALLGYDSLGASLNAVIPTDDPIADLRQMAIAYVSFALAHAGRFRLMFRPDLVDRDNPRYVAAATRALSGFAAAITRQKGAVEDNMAEIFVVWSSIHGMANLVVAGKAQYLFAGATPEQFVETIMPKLLAETWPFGMAH